MFKHLLQLFRRHRRSNPMSNRFRPQLECLEPRLYLTTNWTGGDMMNPTIFGNAGNWDMGLPYDAAMMTAIDDAEFDSDIFGGNKVIELDNFAATQDFTVEEGDIDFRLQNLAFTSWNVEVGTEGVAELLAWNQGMSGSNIWTTRTITIGKDAAGTFDLRDFTVDTDGSLVRVGKDAEGTLKLTNATLDQRGAESTGAFEISVGSVEIIRGDVFSGKTSIGIDSMTGASATLRSIAGVNGEANWDTLGEFVVGSNGVGTLTIEAVDSPTTVDAILTSHEDVTVQTSFLAPAMDHTIVEVKNIGALWHAKKDFVLTASEGRHSTINILNGGVIRVAGETVIGHRGDGILNINDGALDAKQLIVGRTSGSTGTITVTNGSLTSDAAIVGKDGFFPPNGPASGVVELNGSVWMVNGDLLAGDEGNGSISLQSTVAEGESVLSVQGSLTIGELGDVNVDGASRIDVTGTLMIEKDGREKGELHIIGGSEVLVIGGGTNAGILRVSTNGKINTRDQKLFNMGKIIAGNSPGRFTLDGDLEQTTEGTMFVELGGTTAVTDYDVYAVGDFDADMNGGNVTLGLNQASADCDN